ncbi:uncharacterized protein CTRU02_215659 [Colletotrichum truncatum]|uniref:Uncharacterized protein n=1 Tax=Colletotrichum truncatum TaxID=5467 RepID=A0ACC3YCA8_COLTU|nr:uncharacterized protein CTRU02_15805 [Colletotrichum truncatum]XP_036584328.1 uncharacterized protein CTRU02_05403 [Colletotrichum truncatum]KAF6780653.1 hypothetical protein CTRU02_15805 [Colletotrichum truncatum]KAF6793846.1 hypothetical protein CTRU02_05403 [Colletotrichum truncatum]
MLRKLISPDKIFPSPTQHAYITENRSPPSASAPDIKESLQHPYEAHVYTVAVNYHDDSTDEEFLNDLHGMNVETVLQHSPKLPLSITTRVLGHDVSIEKTQDFAA